jgi:thiamine biosynthesis lipoprotein
MALGGRGRGWLVDVSSKRARGRLARLRLREGALATSGAGEQFFEKDGRRYGHVLDPRTGWPAEGTLSVSVVCAEAAVADALSTAFLVGGLDLARRYCAAHPETLALVTPDDGSERPVVVGVYRGAVLEEH